MQCCLNRLGFYLSFISLQINSLVVIFDVQKSVKYEVLISNRLEEHDEDKSHCIALIPI